MKYKWCVVPSCKNTSKKNPEKLFVSVPTNRKRRIKWLQLARRDPNSIMPHSNVFMCEDHFDLQKDISNYMQYKMGFSTNLLLADKAIPTKFHCQKDRRRLCDPDHSIVFPESNDLLKECKVESCGSDTVVSPTERTGHILEIELELLPKTQDCETTTDIKMTADKSFQVKVEYRSESVQTTCQKRDASTSPFKISTTSSHTSFETDQCYLRPLNSGFKRMKKKPVKRNTFRKYEKPDSDNPWLDVVLPTLDLKVEEAWEDKPNDETSEDLAEYFCDNCSKSIVGFRYRCVQCENFDLCRDCEAAMTHPQHYVLRIPRPRPFSEIKSILDAIREKINVLSGELQENRLKLDEIKLELDFVDPAPLEPLRDCPATSYVAASHRATLATSPQHTATSQFKIKPNRSHKRPARISADNNKKFIISQKKDAFKQPQAGPAMDPVVLLDKLHFVKDKEVITLQLQTGGLS